MGNLDFLECILKPVLNPLYFVDAAIRSVTYIIFFRRLWIT
jgi:hypothetical protein